MDKNRKKEKIKACIAIACIVLVILFTGIIAIKYNVEGETQLPFNLKKITVVSTAEGIEKQGAEEKWNLKIYQNNDIYFSIEKNDSITDEEILNSISIENIEITSMPKVGEIKTYMPNSLDGRLFSYEEDYIVEENKLTYKGATKSNAKTLEIGNQGGTAVIRFSNIGIGSLISNDEEEIKHDGTMLTKVGINNEDIKFNVNFYFIINLKNKSYKTNITLELPCDETLITDGTCSKEIIDEFVFKRVNK